MSYVPTVYVPLVRQAYEYSCGAASLASCLYYWGVWDGREPELYSALGTTEEGTSGEGIIHVAKSYGLGVTCKSCLNMDDLRGYLTDGYTLILSIQSWGQYDESTNWDEVWDDGHYVVLVGIVGGDVLLMDPSVAGSYRRMTIAELLRCWHDYTDDGEYDYHGAIILKGSNGPAGGLRPISIKSI